MSLNHECAVKYGSQSNLPRLGRDASCFQKLLRMFRKTTIASPQNPMCRIYFKSNAAIAFERKRHVKTGFLHIIHPFSVFRTYWEFWMVIVLITALMVFPFHVAFESDIGDRLTVLKKIALVCHFACIADIVITFYTGYGVSSTREVVLDPTKIARSYVFSYRFALDAISSFPFVLLQRIFQRHNTVLVWVILNWMSLLKVFRVYTLIKYMNHFADLWQVGLVGYMCFRYIVILILIVHWTACMEYAVPDVVRHFMGKRTSWIEQSRLDELSSNFERYVHCFFRSCGYLFSINHGKYELTSEEDIIMGIVTFIVGNLVLAVLLVLMLQIVSSELSAETKYQEIINEVKEYMGYKQLPVTMQQRLIEFYEYRFQKSFFREEGISATLSERLRREINVFCYRRLVDSVSIFKDMPHHLVVDLVNSLKAEIFLPNDIIVKAGTYGDCMYFLASGTVCVKTPTGKEVCHLYDGAYFGEIALLMKDQKRIANVIAIEICEMYRLDRKSFKTLFVKNTDLYKKLEKVALERREKTLILEELHKKYILALEHPSLWNLNPPNNFN